MNTHMSGPWGQIDPSDGAAYYDIFTKDDSNKETMIVQIVATKTDGPVATGMKKGLEYWKIANGTSLMSLDKGALYVRKTDSMNWKTPPPFIASAKSFSTPVDCEWKHDTNAVPEMGHHNCRDATSFVVGLRRENCQWIGTLEFRRMDDTKLVFARMKDGEVFEFQRATVGFPYTAQVALPLLIPPSGPGVRQ